MDKGVKQVLFPGIVSMLLSDIQKINCDDKRANVIMTAYIVITINATIVLVPLHIHNYTQKYVWLIGNGYSQCTFPGMLTNLHTRQSKQDYKQLYEYSVKIEAYFHFKIYTVLACVFYELFC